MRHPPTLTRFPYTTLFRSVGTYQLQNTNVYNENVSPADQSAIDRVFPKVLLSSFALSAVRDTRDDPIDPRKGEYLSGFGQRSEEHTSELQSLRHLVCRLLL